MVVLRQRLWLGRQTCHARLLTKIVSLRPLLALLALLVVLGLAVGLVFAWLNRHKAQVPEDVAPIVTEAPAAPTEGTVPTALLMSCTICCCVRSRSPQGASVSTMKPLFVEPPCPEIEKILTISPLS